MKKITWMLTSCNIVLSLVLISAKLNCLSKSINNPSEKAPIVKPEVYANISLKTPSFLSYDDLTKQLETWRKEAPNLVETGAYGKSFRNKDLKYLRICKDKKIELPKVLITACIHGNEPLAASCVMAYIGNLLSDFEKDPEVKNLILTRDLYFVPVVSPDSYPSSRLLNKVDPNRDFPTQKNPNHESIHPIKDLQEFFLRIKPDAVMSGHTFGRMYLMPYGDSKKECPDYNEYIRVAGEMARLSKYTLKPCYRLYGKPIFGTELDWYCRNGAFAIVAEFGTHQKEPTESQIQQELERTYDAFKLFIKEAPIVKMNYGFDKSIEFVQNAGIDPDYFNYQKKVVGIKAID